MSDVGLRHYTHHLLPRPLAPGKYLICHGILMRGAYISDITSTKITRTKRFQDYGSCAELKIRYVTESSALRSGALIWLVSVVARNNDILKKLVLEAKREYEKDAEHRVHIFMADTYVRRAPAFFEPSGYSCCDTLQYLRLLAMEWSASEAAYEFHCSRAWCEGYDRGRLQGLPCI